jgi:hypothetical protein
MSTAIERLERKHHDAVHRNTTAEKILAFHDAFLSAMGCGAAVLERSGTGDWILTWHGPHVARRDRYYDRYAARIALTPRTLDDAGAAQRFAEQFRAEFKNMVPSLVEDRT